MSAQTQPISRFPEGSFRELISVQYPLLLSLISSSLMGFCDRLFLARYSLEAFEAVSYAIYICMIFQLGCMRIVAASQVLVSRAIGAGKNEDSGIFTWQVIWFALASILITYPLSQAVSRYFFDIGSIGRQGHLYFEYMMAFNFLFPLGSAFSSFFCGIGKTRIITQITLISHSVNLVLNYSLIFGIPHIIPSLGVAGAAIATGIAQAIYCLGLGYVFASDRYRKFGCRFYKFKLQKFIEILKIGLPAGFTRIHNLCVWSLMMKFIAVCSSTHVLAMSYGSALAFLFAPLNDSAIQALITLFSYYLGNGRRVINRKLMINAHLLGLAHFLVVSGLVVVFNSLFINQFVKEELTTSMLNILLWNGIGYCVFFLSEVLMSISFAWIMAYKESVLLTCLSTTYVWIFGYGGFWLAFDYIRLAPQYTWLVVSAHLWLVAPVEYLGLYIKHRFNRPLPRQEIGDHS